MPARRFAERGNVVGTDTSETRPFRTVRELLFPYKKGSNAQAHAAWFGRRRMWRRRVGGCYEVEAGPSSRLTRLTDSARLTRDDNTTAVSVRRRRTHD